MSSITRALIAVDSLNDYSCLETILGTEAPVQADLFVTVVVPFYRGLALLDRTLASLTIQDYPQHLWELIVVEDGSLEDTAALIRKYQSRLNIRRLRQQRLGYRLCTARNLGIQESNSDVIVLVDFDCVCLPSHLSRHLRWFKPDFPVATFGLREFVDLDDLNPDRIHEWLRTLPDRPRVHSISNRLQRVDKRRLELQYLKHHPFPCNCFHGRNVAFRRIDALSVGLFDTDFDGHLGYEDIEFAYRLTQLGRYLVYEPGATVYHQENNMVTLADRMDGRLVNLRKMFSKVPGIREFRQSIGQT
ncbi:MAG: glycosyltransferase [Ardenticatenaceae bacterium]|nr:glycosyltransferase [Ardenticatenaceae bacterium]